jgi:hypothetical protein
LPNFCWWTSYTCTGLPVNPQIFDFMNETVVNILTGCEYRMIFRQRNQCRSRIQKLPR